MTAWWFLMVAMMIFGGLAVAWRFISVVLEVLREPLPASIAGPRATAVQPRPTAGPRPPMSTITISRPVDDATTDEGAELFARSRAAALGDRSNRRHAVAERRPEREPATQDDRQTPSWDDLLAETLREFAAIHS